MNIFFYILCCCCEGPPSESNHKKAVFPKRNMESFPFSSSTSKAMEIRASNQPNSRSFQAGSLTRSSYSRATFIIKTFSPSLFEDVFSHMCPRTLTCTRMSQFSPRYTFCVILIYPPDRRQLFPQLVNQLFVFPYRNGKRDTAKNSGIAFVKDF